MKRIVVSAPAGSNVINAGKFLESDGSGAVQEYTSGTVLGLSESKFDPNDPLAAGDEKVGVVKCGIVKVKAAAGTYNFGDQVEIVDASTVQPYSAGTIVGTAVESKTLAATGDLYIYVNFA